MRAKHTWLRDCLLGWVLVGSLFAGMSRAPAAEERVDASGIKSLDDFHRIRTVSPIYPVEAGVRGIEGHVVAILTIAANGSVADVEIRESTPTGVFDNAARHALSQWTFAALPSGKAERCMVRLTFEVSG